MLSKIIVRKTTLAVLTPMAVLIIAACSSAVTPVDSTPAESPNTAPSSAPTQAPESVPAPAPTQIQVALATSDFGVGKNRVVFGVIDSVAGPLTDATVEVSSFRLTDNGQEGPIETIEATYRRWPAALRGVYIVELSFDQPGSWGIGAIVTRSDGMVSPASVRIDVKENASTPKVGSLAPRSATKTLADVGGVFEQITTDREPDAELYEMTIADALDTGKPLLVTFSTPLYCQTATCGPQLDVVKELKDKYRGQANFVHVEVYDNPDEIEGDPVNNGKIAPALIEWGLPSEPWTFIVDKNGRVHAKFEAFTTMEELEESLNDVL